LVVVRHVISKIPLSDVFFYGFLADRTQRVRIGDYSSETIYCQSLVPQGSHLAPLFFIADDINDVLEIFENVRILAYSDDLRLYMRFSSTDDCFLFQQDFDRLQRASNFRLYNQYKFNKLHLEKVFLVFVRIQVQYRKSVKNVTFSSTNQDLSLKKEHFFQIKNIFNSKNKNIFSTIYGSGPEFVLFSCFCCKSVE
jgi:hypothetical protein